MARPARIIASPVYVNDLGDEGGQRARDAYGANYPRLAALKARYDPDNVFRLNQNIAPANRSGRAGGGGGGMATS